jgi:magnesium transporter
MKNENTSDEHFLNKASIIKYTENDASKNTFEDIKNVSFINQNEECIHWLNVYGFQFTNQFKQVIKQNKLDDFLNILLTENESRNKVIELDECIFMTINTLHYNKKKFSSEQMMFVASSNFVWSVQEKPGDYFQHIRTRISENKGIVRRKKADYLLYLIIDAIIDNYYNAYEKLTQKLEELKDLTKVKPNLDYAVQIEENKQNLFVLKKAISSLREAISKLEKVELKNFEPHYFSELKEQANFLIDDIDFDLQQLESSINLIFNMQNHKLNEVMKTLTILSVIFIPLTFLAGIYGMNFENIPELKYKYGYFILLTLMVMIGIGSFIYFKRKKWLE